MLQECVNALKETFHPACFVCAQCGQTVGQGAFHLEDGQIFCENGEMLINDYSHSVKANEKSNLFFDFYCCSI